MAKYLPDMKRVVILNDKLLQEKRAEEYKKRDEEEESKKIKQELGDFIAKSVLIQKTKTGEEIFSKNKDNLLPIASLTKLVNAIIVLKNKPDKIIVTKRSLTVTGEYGLLPYEEFNLNDAVDFMLIGSINDIASAIAFGYKNISKN
jgi:D-alanyl-D-alanine carboxypeptidase